MKPKVTMLLHQMKTSNYNAPLSNKNLKSQCSYIKCNLNQSQCYYIKYKKKNHNAPISNETTNHNDPISNETQIDNAPTSNESSNHNTPISKENLNHNAPIKNKYLKLQCSFTNKNLKPQCSYIIWKSKPQCSYIKWKPQITILLYQMYAADDFSIKQSFDLNLILHLNVCSVVCNTTMVLKRLITCGGQTMVLKRLIIMRWSDNGT